MPNPTKTPENQLHELCKGLLPHIAKRVQAAYWLGALDGAEVEREARRDRDKAELLGEARAPDEPYLDPGAYNLG